MKVLVIKLTSMGDALHLLPALSDLYKHHPQVSVDWMVEGSFAEIPTWHPVINRVIRVSTRRWRSFEKQNLIEFKEFVHELRIEQYDVVLDAQGLMKSAGLGLFAKLNKGGKRVGFSADSIKERFAARLYKEKISVAKNQHAVDRLRQLFASAFDYSISEKSPLNYQIRLPATQSASNNQRTIFFLHGTTWSSKHLPDKVWRDLVDLVTDDGYQVKLCWGNDVELARAEWIAQNNVDVDVLPKLSLTELASKIKHAAGVISVDTGLGHLSAAMGIPAVSVYGSTNANLTGAVGENQTHIQTDYRCSPCLLKICDKLTDRITTPPCYKTVSAANIWQSLYARIA